MLQILSPDWVRGLLGGLMIGTAAAMYLAVNGRILGASGILGGLADGTGRDSRGERLAFVGALIAVPAAAVALMGGYETHLTTSLPLLILGGVATGVGTRMANGCTSGHGVCGISRPTTRGIVASAVYVGAGMAVFALLRQLVGGI